MVAIPHSSYPRLSALGRASRRGSLAGARSGKIRPIRNTPRSIHRSGARFFSQSEEKGGVPLDFAAFLGRVGLFVNDQVLLR